MHPSNKKMDSTKKKLAAIRKLEGKSLAGIIISTGFAIYFFVQSEIYIGLAWLLAALFWKVYSHTVQTYESILDSSDVDEPNPS